MAGFYAFTMKGVKLLEKIADAPKTPHYVVQTDDSFSSYTESYGPNDSGSYTHSPFVRTWICDDRDALQRLIEEINAKGAKCVFYHVASLGSVQIKVNVNLDVE